MKYLKLIIPLFITIVFAIWVVLDRKKHLVEESAVYAIGEIYNINIYQSKYFEYQFFDGKAIRKSRFLYKGAKSRSFLRKHYIGKKYLIRFSKEKPIYSEILLSKRVPKEYSDSIKYVWDKPPF